MEKSPSRADWTSGPAKWAAVGVLGAASIGGMAWSILGREPRARAVMVPAPVPVVSADASGPPDAGEPSSTLVAPSRSSGQAPETVARVINLNTASGAELELLPGIGPALAARILEYRKEHGRFRSVDELDNVKGIGPRTLEKLRPLVTIE